MNRTKKIRLSEERYRNLIHSAQDGLFLLIEKQNLSHEKYSGVNFIQNPLTLNGLAIKLREVLGKP